MAALEVAAAEVAGPEAEAGVGVAWGVEAAGAECFNSQIYIQNVRVHCTLQIQWMAFSFRLLNKDLFYKISLSLATNSTHI